MAYREPEFLPWDGRRVPLTFVGGYLGAGKTTAINALLAQTDRPIAVLVNDVGEIGVDARLVRRRHGDTIELADGCVCCSLVDGFGAAFDQLRARETPPDHVVVELSGVADPQRVLPWGQSAGFVLDGVIVVVAADQLVDAALPAHVRAAIEQQITAADLLVLTKTDVVASDVVDQASQVLRRLAPHVPVFESGPRGPESTGSFLALGGRRPGGAADTPGPTLFDAHDVHAVAMPRDLSAERIDAELDAVLDRVQRSSGRIVRAKGVLGTSDGGRLLVQVVGSRREVTDLPPAEFQDCTDLTVITLRPDGPQRTAVAAPTRRGAGR